jgi:hypothetical protein
MGERRLEAVHRFGERRADFGPAKAKASSAISSRVGTKAGAAGSSTSPTRRKVCGSRANHPTVSKLAARSTTPSTGTRPCVERMPKIPQ